MRTLWRLVVMVTWSAVKHRYHSSTWGYFPWLSLLLDLSCWHQGPCLANFPILWFSSWCTIIVLVQPNFIFLINQVCLLYPETFSTVANFHTKVWPRTLHFTVTHTCSRIWRAQFYYMLHIYILWNSVWNNCLFISHLFINSYLLPFIELVTEICCFIMTNFRLQLPNKVAQQKYSIINITLYFNL